MSLIPIFGISWYKEDIQMANNTSMTLGDHFDGLIAQQIESGQI